MVVHLLLSALFGAIFGIAVATLPWLSRTTGSLIVASSLFGFLLWLINIYVIAPIVGWTWFRDDTEPLVQFFAHVFFYGTVVVLGLDAIVAVTGNSPTPATTVAQRSTQRRRQP